MGAAAFCRHVAKVVAQAITASGAGIGVVTEIEVDCVAKLIVHLPVLSLVLEGGEVV